MDERDKALSEVCQRSTERLAGRLPGVEVACLLRFGDILRHVGHVGRLPLIYELPRDLGGVTWRAVEQHLTQLVEDVRADPDYLAFSSEIRSEVAVPVEVWEAVVGVLNVESQRQLGAAEAGLVEEEAVRLADELAPFFHPAPEPGYVS